MAELEARHDNAADLFASGRRYERAWAGLRAPTLDSLIADLKQQLKAARLEAAVEAAVEVGRMEGERDELAAVVERVRAQCAAWKDTARRGRKLLPPPHDYSEAQRDCANELEALLPKESP